MTLVYERSREEAHKSGPTPHPVTHAFIIGCGRFPNFKAAQGMDRASTVEGARQMAQFLIRRADDFVAPIASIECLLSDPAETAGNDRLVLDLDPQTVPELSNVKGLAGRSVPVDAANYDNTKAAGNAWLDRCEEGDHLLFYMSSHGVGDMVAAIGLLEDVAAKPRTRWQNSLNITALAQGAQTTGADRSWLFFDACQEVVADWTINGTPGLTLIDFTLKQALKAGRRKPLALAAARLGQRAWAPTDGKPPYFTQALLEGLENLCVEPVSGLGWAVTGEKLWFSLKNVADAAVGWTGLEPEPLMPFNEQGVALIKAAKPEVAIVLRTSVESDFLSAQSLSAVCEDQAVPEQTHVPDGQSMAWRFRVPADQAHRYKASAAFPAGGKAYQPEWFNAVPPAQIVVLKP